jgi:PAS domain S-box-containing protein
MTGFTPAEWCSTPSLWRRQLHPDDRERVITALEQSIEAGTPFTDEYRLLTKSGQMVWIRDRGRIVQGDASHTSFFQGFMVDVTVEHRMEQRLLQSQKLESLGIMAGGIAHDFNNLLTVILGNADLALEDIRPARPGHNELQLIREASLRAKGLTGQMLTYTGRVPVAHEKVDVNQLLESMSVLLAAAVSKKAKLRWDLAAGLPFVEADPNQLQQIIMNLLTNASEALQDKPGSIVVSTDLFTADEPIPSEWSESGEFPAGRYVSLEVRDTGAGMDQATRLRMFDPFFSTKFTGRGLGLAAVLGTVRQQCGAIFVETAQGLGTSVRVLLPASDRVAAGQILKESHAPDHPPHPQRTILVVDDEEGVRDLIRAVLQRQGYRVISASDGRQAIERYRKHAREIDAVLLDLTMPELDGEATLAELQAIAPAVRVVLMSGYSESKVAGRFASKGTAAFLQKPFRHKELLEILHRIVK